MYQTIHCYKTSRLKNAPCQNYSISSFPMNVLGVMYFSRHKKLFYTSDLPLAFKRIKTKDQLPTVHSLTLPLGNRPPASKSEPCLLQSLEPALGIHQRGLRESHDANQNPDLQKERAAGCRQAGAHRLRKEVAVTAVPTVMSLVLRRTMPHGTATHFV